MTHTPEPSAPPAEAIDEGAPIAIAVPVDVHNVDENTVPLASSANLADDDSDVAARAAAAASREEGIASIRSHLNDHLRQNPRSSYVTWIATLHPENAHVTIDPRFHIPGNPWLTVFEETKNDLQKGERLPTSAVEPVDDDTEKKKATFSGFLDLLVGACLVFAAIASAFTIETCAMYTYLSYWLCARIVAKCSPATCITCLPLSVAWILMNAFQFMDLVMLVVGITVAEAIAAANFFLCTILACSIDVGKNAHQTTRKLAHHVRWAFHSCFEKWNPPRRHCGSGTTDQ